MLQSITLIDLSKSDLIAFFLNIYHTLLLHAYVVLGVPTSGIDWKALKSSISYEISGDIMTLRDIDEIILGKYYYLLYTPPPTTTTSIIMMIGNISNKVVVFNFLRIQLSQSEAYKQIESRRPKQLDPSLMFPSSRLYFGELWDYSIPMSHGMDILLSLLLSFSISTFPHCIWTSCPCNLFLFLSLFLVIDFPSFLLSSKS